MNAEGSARARQSSGRLNLHLWAIIEISLLRFSGINNIKYKDTAYPAVGGILVKGTGINGVLTGRSGCEKESIKINFYFHYSGRTGLTCVDPLVSAYTLGQLLSNVTRIRGINTLAKAQ